MHRFAYLCAGAAMACAATAMGQTGKFIDLVVTTDDGDSVVEPGETALICLYVDMTPNVGQGIEAFAAASFDTLNEQNGETGQITEFGCLNFFELCSPMDLTMTDGVNLFGTSVGQLLIGGGVWSDDDPIGVYQFRWETDDFTPRVVKYTTETKSMAFWLDEFTTVEPETIIEADICFCVGSCPPSKGPDLPWGLPHDGGGGGIVFSVDDIGTPQIGPIGAAEQTLTVEVGEVDCFLTSPLPRNTPDGSYLELVAAREIIGGPLEEILSTRVLYDNDVLNFYFDAAPVSPAAASVVGELQGVVVLASTCAECNFANDAICKAPGAEMASISPYVIDGADGVVRVEFAKPVEVFAFDGASALVDAIELRAIGMDPIPTMTHVQHNMSNLDFLTLRSESVSMFGHQHFSLDGAQMMGVDEHLVLSNIGASGDDGVEMQFDPAAAFGVMLELDAFELEPVRVVSYNVGGTGTTFDTEIVSMDLTGNLVPNQTMLTPNLAAIAEAGASVQAQLLAAGNLVATLSGPVESPPQIVADGLVLPTITANALSPMFHLSCDTPTFFQAFDAAGQLLGTVDEIVYSVSAQSMNVEVVLHAQATAANTEALVIVDEFLTPLSECVADCDGNGVLNILDFVCFQNLFTTMAPDADCDGNGVLNILDFICFQNAFTAGCG